MKTKLKLKLPTRKCRICAVQFQPKLPSQFICSKPCVRELYSRITVASLTRYRIANGFSSGDIRGN